MPTKSGIDFGTFYLDNNLNDWFVDHTKDNFVFKNSNGIEANFIVKYKSINDITYYDLNERKATGDCSVQTSDMFKAQYQYIIYNSAKASLNISYMREKTKPSTYPSDATWRYFSSMPEKIAVTIGSDEYYFSLDTDTINQLIPSIKLFNKTFSDVINLKKLIPETNPSFVKAIYYKKVEGVVAFEFLNGELWEKQ